MAPPPRRKRTQGWNANVACNGSGDGNGAAAARHVQRYSALPHRLKPGNPAESIALRSANQLVYMAACVSALCPLALKLAASMPDAACCYTTPALRLGNNPATTPLLLSLPHAAPHSAAHLGRPSPATTPMRKRPAPTCTGAACTRPPKHLLALSPPFQQLPHPVRRTAAFMCTAPASHQPALQPSRGPVQPSAHTGKEGRARRLVAAPSGRSGVCVWGGAASQWPRRAAVGARFVGRRRRWEHLHLHPAPRRHTSRAGHMRRRMRTRAVVGRQLQRAKKAGSPTYLSSGCAGRRARQGSSS